MQRENVVVYVVRVPAEMKVWVELLMENREQKYYLVLMHCDV